MTAYPFSAVVGQDEAKLALLLAAVEPAIGGVLLRGEKGTAKTTLARGLAALLPGDAPFVDLPVGATEDRVVGSIDVTAALTGGEVRFSPGLLAAAHGGVLYVDEVNLLPDHLVDVLLDVAATGRNRVEREGVSHVHDARFVLIGSMNPEEGELRPQLLDRFGLCVDVTSHGDPEVRAGALAARLAFDADPAGVILSWLGSEDELRGRLVAARAASLDPALLHRVASLCASMGAEGLRADLTVCRTAAALAGWEGREATTVEDVRWVAPLALVHRRRRSPLDDHGGGPDDLDEALDEALGDQPDDGARGGQPDAEDEEAGTDAADAADRADQGPQPGADTPRPPTAPDAPERVVPILVPGSAAAPSGRRSSTEGVRGRTVGVWPAGEDRTASVAVGATARAAATRRAGAPPAPGEALVAAQDLRVAVREQRTGALVILVVDTSGSMGGRMAAAKGAVLSLLLDAYQRRDQVAMVAVGGGGADIVLRPTGSVEVARARLERLPTGGRTDLAAGLRLGASLGAAPAGDRSPLLVVVTDGRATAGPDGQDPVAAAEAEAAVVRRRAISAVVVDVEDGPHPLGLAQGLAAAMGARHLRLPDLSAGALDRTVRSALGR